MTRIVSWNIDKGGIDQHGLADALEELNPDVVVLIEARQPSSTGDLAAVLRGRGWRWMAMSPVDAKGNAVLVAARGPFDASPIVGEHLEHGTVMRISLSGSSFDIYGCEFPATGKKWSHRLMWDAVMAQANVSATPVMMVGDLNTGAHEIDEEGSCICRDDFADLAAIGWRDLYREVHGQQLTFSWRSPYGNRFRMDHALGRHDLGAEIVGIDYVNHLGRRPLWPGVAYPGQKVLSDHAPLVIDVADVSGKVDTTTTDPSPATAAGSGWLESLRGFAATCTVEVDSDLSELVDDTSRRIDGGVIGQIPTMDLRRCLTALIATIGDTVTSQLELDLRAIEAELLRRHRRAL